MKEHSENSHTSGSYWKTSPIQCPFAMQPPDFKLDEAANLESVLLQGMLSEKEPVGFAWATQQ